MNWKHLKEKFRMFDETGLDKTTVLNMRLIIIAVMGGMVWGNITGGIAFTGYWKELGVSDTIYGFVLALPMIANAFQFFGSYLMEKTRKRTKIFITTGLIQRMSWIPFALVPFIIPMSAAWLRVWMAGLLVLVSAGMMPFMNVAFISICDDVIPMRIRGRYFASRSRVSTLTGLVVGLLVGVLLDVLPGMKGYCAAFLIAGVMGTFDIVCFFFMKLPEMKVTPKRPPILGMMKEVVSDRNYMRIVLYGTLWMFTIQLCAPYFNVFMQGDMGMSNFQIMLCGQIASNALLILVVTRWGRSLDAFGSKPVMLVGGTLIAVMPMLWTGIGKGMAWAVMLTNMLSGATWCTYELGIQNLYMNQAKGENKSMYFAVFAMFTQLLGSALGSFSGGWILDNILCHTEKWHVVFMGWEMTRYNWLFLFTSLLRFSVLFLFLHRIEEPGAVSVKEFVGETWKNTSLSAKRTIAQLKFMRRRRG